MKIQKDVKKALRKNGMYCLYFPFNWETLAKVKKIEGRQYVPKGKYWKVPITVVTTKALKEAGFFMADVKEDKALPEIKLPELKKIPFAYQKNGIAFLEKKKGRALLADEMGLGKTLQVLAWTAIHPEIKKVLIITPASLKFNWKKEIDDLFPLKQSIEIIQGKTTFALSAKYVIINYDILSAWTDSIQEYAPTLVITDESHFYKNNKAQRTKAVKKVVKKADYFIALSGTPITNRPIEFYNVLSLLDKNCIPNYWQYAMRYCGAKNNGFGWDFSGSSNSLELHNRINNIVMLRRKKKDVLKDLPGKLYSHVPLEIDNRKKYNLAQKNFVAFMKGELKEQITKKLTYAGIKETEVFINHEEIEREAKEKSSTLNALTELEKLKQIAVRGKLNSVLKWVDEFLETSDEKLILFATHKFIIQELMKKYGAIAVKIDGGVSQQERYNNVQAFQMNPNIRIFIGNIQAAGTGLTLTAASNVVFIELPHTPGELDQAADRAHRIGQKNTVNIYYLIAMGTVEQKIAKIIDKKRRVLDAVLDGKETQDFMLIEELMKQL